MTGVSSLAGYLTTAGGRAFTFSIIQNGFTGSSTTYKKSVEEAICGLLVKTFEREAEGRSR